MSNSRQPLAANRVHHAIKVLAITASIALPTSTLVAQSTSTSADQTPVASASVAPATVSPASHAIRASKVIGMEVLGGAGKTVGKIKDLIINVNTADVRYAVLEFDPGFLKSDQVFAVPLSALTYVADEKPLRYKEVTRAQLEKAAVNKADWQKALDNSRYVSAMDQNYGYKPPTGEARSIRASKLIGKSVGDRAGKGIGEIQDLVLDMAANKVDYAVLAFDPSWLSREKLFAFPLTAFTTARDKEKDELMLDVDRTTVQAMKNFDASRWGSLNDLNREEFINRPPAAR